MVSVQCVLFDCDGTLVDSEILCCEALSLVFNHYTIPLSTQTCIQQFKGNSLYQIFEHVRQQYPQLPDSDPQLEHHYRQKVARLFDEKLQPIAGIESLLSGITVSMAVVSNGPVSKMQHSLGLTGLLRYFGEHLYSAFDIQRWKPDPALLETACCQLGIPLQTAILIEDSLVGVQAGIHAGIPVFYYCADPHNEPIEHPLVTHFQHMSELPKLWQQQGLTIYREPNNQ